MNKVIDFVKIKNIMIGISVVVIIAEIAITYVTGGLNLGIDFQPGLSLEINTHQQSNVNDIKNLLLSKYPSISIQSIGNAGEEFNIKVSDKKETKDFQNVVQKDVMNILSKKFSKIEKQAEYYIGPSLSKSSTKDIILISLAVLVLILIYVAFRFHWTYALGAILALFHDGIISFYFIGVTKIEFSIPVVVAIITILGYSLNDTIVVFDRIRENIKLQIDSNLSKIINISITSTLKRSLLTSFTTLITMIALVFFTKNEIRNFSLTMIVGIIAGTYSSIFIASPMLLFLKKESVLQKKSSPNPKNNKEEGKNESKNGQIDFEKERKKLEQQIKHKKK